MEPLVGISCSITIAADQVEHQKEAGHRQEHHDILLAKTLFTTYTHDLSNCSRREKKREMLDFAAKYET